MNLVERDNQFIWHPFTSQSIFKNCIVIEKGEATLLIDENSKTYIDAISSWWVTLHGHAHPYIAEMIYKQALQLEQVIFAGFTHKPAVDLAEKLIKILPGGLSKVFYSDNGSTATEVALKMAIQYWWNLKDEDYSGKDKRKIKQTILAFKNSYHGDTFGAMSVSSRNVFTLAFQDLLFEVIFIDVPSAENITELKELIKNRSEEIAAFIYEPLVQGAGGMRMYDASLMNELLETTRQHNIICIADEVMTGFGRTRKLFASEYMEVKPDIICLSKGLTGGTMALGVTACNDKIYGAYSTDDKLKTFFHGHSFTANPLACTAALASLDLLFQDNCMQKIQWITNENKMFAEHLTTEKFPVKNIRMLGTIIAFEIDKGKDEYLNDVSVFFMNSSLEKGVYLRPLGNTVYIMPPYCITKDELKHVYNVITQVLEEMI